MNAPVSPLLIIRMPDGAQLEYPVETEEVHAGRQAGSDLLLADASVSRTHAVLRFQAQGITLEDLGSSNGTYVNGEALAPRQPRWVGPGDAIRLGAVELRIVLPRPAPPAAAVPAPAHQAQPLPPAADELTPVPQAQPLPPAAAAPAPVPQARPATAVGSEPAPVSQAQPQPPAAAAPAPVPQARPGAAGRAVQGTKPATRRIWLVLGCALLALIACLVLGWVVWRGGRGLLQRLQGRPPASLGCVQPPLSVLSWGGKVYAPPTSLARLPTYTPRAPTSVPTDTLSAPSVTPLASATDTPTAAVLPGEPVLLSDSGFLELPFPMDGGNVNFGGSDEQFRVASQRNTGKSDGRVNSFFDHLYPLYPAPKDPGLPGGSEPAEPPAGENILLFSGSLSPYFSYSGHPGFDYSTYEYRKATTPVFAAAAGVVAEVFEHKSGALVVRLVHPVEGVGSFQTSYWHLEPDEFFEVMRGRVGEPVAAGERIGTMGNTGYSTGHHLHFEVRFDANGDGLFSSQEVVDPYGWVPSPDYPADPWQQRSGVESRYLWVHPLGVVSAISQDGGGAIVQDPGRGGGGPDEAPASSQACLPPGSLPPGGRVYWSWSPDPPPGEDGAGIGRGCTLAVFDPAGQPVRSFPQPVKIEIPYLAEDLVNVDRESLAIYWRSQGQGAWERLDTTLFPQEQVAVAFTSSPGDCSLRGDPLGDLIPPQTEITLSGEQAGDGAFYDQVQVSLKAEDNLGVARTEYSLDAGRSWQVYDGPIIVKPERVIPQAEAMDEEFFAGGPGTYLILAVSVDEAGNREEPPAYRAFSIDPSKHPTNPLRLDQAPTVTPVPQPTETPVPEARSACDHPFMPIRPGASWEYTSPYGPVHWEVTEVGDGSAVITRDYIEDGAKTQATTTWLCDENGLFTYLSAINMDIFVDGFYVTYALLDQRGIDFPPVELLVPGYSWEEWSLMEARHNGEVLHTNDATVAYTVVGPVPVTIQGKVYDGIELSVTVSGTATTEGQSAEASTTFTVILARGVGYYQYDQIILTSFNIP